MRWPLADETVAPRLQQALERNTGYAVENIGDATFTALPWPTLQISHVTLKKPSSPHERVSIPLVKARINMASWLWGEPKVVTLSLFDPVVYLVSSEKISESEALSSTVLNFLQADRRPDLRLLRTARATVMLDGEPWMTGLRLNVSNTVGLNIRVKAQLNYRAVPVSLLADVAQGAQSQDRSINWSVATTGLTARFAGNLFGPRSIDAEGRFDLQITGSEPLQAMGVSAVHAGLVSGFSLSGDTRVTWPSIQIRRAVMIRGDDRLDGSVEVMLDAASPRLSATLDTKRLDLTPLSDLLASRFALNDSQWPLAVLPTSWLHAATGDIRLSAERVVVGGLTIDQAALSAQLGAGRFETILSEGKIRNGTIKGRASVLSSQPAVVDVRAQGALDKVDAAGLLEPMGITRVRGVSSGQFTLEATGRSMADLAASADGRAQITIRDGEASGVDLDRFAGRIERTLARGMTLEGRTRFQSLALQARITRGTAVLSDSLMVTPAVRMPIEGTVSLTGRSFDLTGRPLPGGETPRSGDIRLRIEGPWSNPSLHPDITGRTNRS
jgi:hypothetical protein